MKKETVAVPKLLCIIAPVVLALCIVLTAVSFVRMQHMSRQLAALQEETQQLHRLNQDLQAQLALHSEADAQSSAVNPEDWFCTLVLDSWSIEDGVLKADTFAQAVLAQNLPFTAQIELWQNDVVLGSQSAVLDLGEAAGIFEGDVSVTFPLPELSEGEQVQLMLVVEPADSDTLFCCGASWYPENGQYMLITG